jgi:cytochrome P450
MWFITRRAWEAVQVGAYRSQRTFFLISPYITHRDPRYFAYPEAFVPARWAATLWGHGFSQALGLLIEFAIFVDTVVRGA